MVLHACNPSIQRWRQEDCEFQARLGYTMRYCLKEKEREGKKKNKKKEKCISNKKRLELRVWFKW
jgi:hypothetical protein